MGEDPKFEIADFLPKRHLYELFQLKVEGEQLFTYSGGWDGGYFLYLDGATISEVFGDGEKSIKNPLRERRRSGTYKEPKPAVTLGDYARELNLDHNEDDNGVLTYNETTHRGFTFPPYIFIPDKRRAELYDSKPELLAGFMNEAIRLRKITAARIKEIDAACKTLSELMGVKFSRKREWDLQESVAGFELIYDLEGIVVYFGRANQYAELMVEYMPEAVKPLFHNTTTKYAGGPRVEVAVKHGDVANLIKMLQADADLTGKVKAVVGDPQALFLKHKFPQILGTIDQLIDLNAQIQINDSGGVFFHTMAVMRGGKSQAMHLKPQQKKDLGEIRKQIETLWKLLTTELEAGDPRLYHISKLPDELREKLFAAAVAATPETKMQEVGAGNMTLTEYIEESAKYRAGKYIAEQILGSRETDGWVAQTKPAQRKRRAETGVPRLSAGNR